MIERITAWVVTALLLTCPGLSTAQTLPVLNLGFSGSGIGADLLKVTERANLWRKHGIDVRPIYLTSGSLMAQTLSAGDISLAGFDVTAMDRKSTRLNSSHVEISYAVFCLKK